MTTTGYTHFEHLVGALSDAAHDLDSEDFEELTFLLEEQIRRLRGRPPRAADKTPGGRR